MQNVSVQLYEFSQNENITQIQNKNFTIHSGGFPSLTYALSQWLVPSQRQSIAWIPNIDLLAYLWILYKWHQSFTSILVWLLSVNIMVVRIIQDGIFSSNLFLFIVVEYSTKWVYWICHLLLMDIRVFSFLCSFKSISSHYQCLIHNWLGQIVKENYRPIKMMSLLQKKMQ